jgi:hypothetical protein
MKHEHTMKKYKKIIVWKAIVIGVVIVSVSVLVFVLVRTHLMVTRLEAQITTLISENSSLRKELGRRNRWIEQRIEEVLRLNKEISREKARRILQEIWKRANEYQLTPDLIWAVIRTESCFDPRAVSDKGALGLMQVMPEYHPLPEGWNPFNIEINIAWGCAVLANYVRKMDDYQWALRAYYAGEEGAQCKEAEEYLVKIQKALVQIQEKSVALLYEGRNQDLIRKDEKDRIVTLHGSISKGGNARPQRIEDRIRSSIAYTKRKGEIDR